MGDIIGEFVMNNESFEAVTLRRHLTENLEADVQWVRGGRRFFNAPEWVRCAYALIENDGRRIREKHALFSQIDAQGAHIESLERQIDEMRRKNKPSFDAEAIIVMMAEAMGIDLWENC